MSFSTFFVSKDTVGSGEDNVTELSGRKDIAGPLFEFRNRNIVSGGNDTTLVDSSNKFNNDLLRSVIINNFEFTNVAILLHDSQESKENLRNGSQKNLLLTHLFSVD